MWSIPDRKIANKGYVYVSIPEHPKATGPGRYVYEHRAVMENHIGRILDDDEIVHHINGDKTDNRIENLRIMTKGEHSAEHARGKTISVAEVKCPECGKVFFRRKNQTHLSKGGSMTFCSRGCSGRYWRRIQLDGIPDLQPDCILRVFAVSREDTHRYPGV